MNISLTPSDAIGAILVNADGQVLLQLRDDKPDIFFPDRWGLFGGGVEADEVPEAALVREVREELGIDISSLERTLFSEFTLDFGCWGHGVVYRKFYLVDIRDYGLQDFTLGEGRECRYFDLDYAVSTLKMVPYDALALSMYQATLR